MRKKAINQKPLKQKSTAPKEKKASKHKNRRAAGEQNFKNLSISKKLQYSFAMPIISFVVAVVFSIAGILFIGSNLTHFYNNSYKVMTLQLEMQKNLEATSVNVLSACTTADEKLLQKRISAAEQEIESLHNNFSKLKKIYKGNQKDLESLESTLENNKQFEQLMLSTALDRNARTAIQVYDGYYAPSISNVKAILLQVGKDAEASASKDYSLSNLAMLIVAIFCTGLAIFSLIISIRSIRRMVASLTKPLYEIEGAAKQMAKGNLHVDITYESADELGSLAHSMKTTTSSISGIIDDIDDCLQTISSGNFNFNSAHSENYIGDYASILSSMENIADSLSVTISEIKEAASQVAQGAENLSEGAQSLAEGAADQATAVEELSSTVNDVTAKVEDAANSSKIADQMALEVTNKAKASSEQMQQMTDAMKKITETSSQIAIIINSIENIASQTNLLSLNAAIEAARAGEAGRGFAVVADEIGELAKQSAAAAMNTRQLIQSTVHEIESGNEIVEVTSSSLSQVVASIDKVRDIIQKTAELSSEQAHAMEDIDKGILQISAVVQNTSATAQESSATSEELTAQSEALDSLVGQFITKE